MSRVEGRAPRRGGGGVDLRDRAAAQPHADPGVDEARAGGEMQAEVGRRHCAQFVGGGEVALFGAAGVVAESEFAVEQSEAAFGGRAGDLAPRTKLRTVPSMHPSLRRTALAACLFLSTAMSGTVPTPPDDMQIFLLIGQSNLAGCGAVEAQDRTPHPRVFMLTKELAWAPAVDPMHFDKPDRIGTGLGRTFGLELAEADPAAVIGLVPAAFGGSTLDEWAPGQPHYVNALSRVREALKHGRLAGILWHQGESDSAPEKTATYAERFAKMIARLRADLDAQEVPVIVGETGRFRSGGTAINVVLARLPALVPHCAFVSAEGLVDRGDKLHFDSASFRELGRRYAVAWQALQPAPVVLLQPMILVPKKE